MSAVLVKYCGAMHTVSFVLSNFLNHANNLALMAVLVVLVEMLKQHCYIITDYEYDTE